MQEKHVSGQKLVLCCGRRKGCPEITEDQGGFVLSEHGQSVQLDREQAELLVKYLQDRLSR